MNRARANVRLPPEVNRVLYVRNLPYKITAEEMYELIIGFSFILRCHHTRISFIMAVSLDSFLLFLYSFLPL